MGKTFSALNNCCRKNVQETNEYQYERCSIENVKETNEDQDEKYRRQNVKETNEDQDEKCSRQNVKETNEDQEEISSLENETNVSIVASICLGAQVYGYCYAFKPHTDSSRRISPQCKVWNNSSLNQCTSPRSIICQSEYMFIEDNVNCIRKRYSKEATNSLARIIRQVKEDLLTTLKKRKPEFRDTDIHWILTVPAICTIKAYQFMRKAAEQGGIPRNQLKIVLEPVAAAIFCAQDKLPDGSRYLVINFGGETIDITVHTKGNESMAYAVVIPVVGVKEFFEQFCSDKIGKDNFDAFKKNEPGDYYNLMSEFELKKIFVTDEDLSSRSGNISIQLPTSLVRMFNTSVVRSCNPNNLQVDSLIIQPQVFQSFCVTNLDIVVQDLQEVIIAPEMKNITTMMVVGDFAGSSFVISRLKNEFPNWTIFHPADPGLAILKGAVQYGLKYYDESDLEVHSITQSEQEDCDLYNDNQEEGEQVKPFLIGIFGSDVLREMMLWHASDFYDLWKAIHEKIQDCQQYSENINFRISHTWGECYKKINGVSLKDGLIERSDLNGTVQCKRDMLIIRSTFFQSKFMPSI